MILDTPNDFTTHGSGRNYFIEANDTNSNKNYHDRRLDAPMIIRVNFTHHGSRQNYLHKQMMLIVINTIMTRDWTPQWLSELILLLIRVNFTPHGSRQNYL
jgi:hypothetical protein